LPERPERYLPETTTGIDVARRVPARRHLLGGYEMGCGKERRFSRAYRRKFQPGAPATLTASFFFCHDTREKLSHRGREPGSKFKVKNMSTIQWRSLNLYGFVI
jgi:hypothetical protein